MDDRSDGDDNDRRYDAGESEGDDDTDVEVIIAYQYRSSSWRARLRLWCRAAITIFTLPVTAAVISSNASGLNPSSTRLVTPNAVDAAIGAASQAEREE